MDMALQLSQQSEGNNRTKYNYKLNTAGQIVVLKNMDPNFLECVSTFTYPPHPTFLIFPIPHTKILPPSTSAIFNAVYIINCLPQQFNITSNLQSSKNVTQAVLYHNAPPIFHSSLQCNEHNLAPETQHQNFSLLPCVCHAI